MRKRYHCPKHKEQTPSAVVYHDAYHCFGCGARGPINELGLSANEKAEPEYVEDLNDSISAIKRLPKRDIRGFQLHANDRGYYLLWPNDQYYKYRSFTVDTPGGKYRGPSGHRKPWFVCSGPNDGTKIALVEGEFNALSLASLEVGYPVASPGGAGDFYSGSARPMLLETAGYDLVHIIVDNDAAGAQAAIESKARLVITGCRDVRIHLVDKDFNDVLTEKGKDGLREYATSLGLL